MATSSYALICPHCLRKLRVRGAAAGWEVRCSFCHGTFATPPAPAPYGRHALLRSNPRCPCGNVLALKLRDGREDIQVRCPRCGRWLTLARDPVAAPAPARRASPPRPARRVPPTPPPIPLPAAPPPVPTPAAAAPSPPVRRHDIERAQHVLAGLLPSEPPNVPGLDMATFHQFRHEVGGDYYDFLPLADGRVGIAIGDVSGKGVGAALLMVRLREILHSVVAHSTSAIETVAAVNARLVRNIPRGMYITFQYAVLDPDARELRIVNAGHCAPLVWRARLASVRLLLARGPALGLLQPEPFEQAIAPRAVPLEPADCLCFFTDGVTEAKDPRGEEFGETRLAAALRHHAGRSAREIADAIVAAGAAHTRSAEQHDDITLIVLKVL